jgi:exosome complex component RRP4
MIIALYNRYTGDIGDVVVGRIIDVGDKRWGVDIGSRQNSILLLASVNLPGGVQRRRTHEDSLQMRQFFQENDLISVSVNTAH